VVDGWFKSRSGQTKNYKIGICCFADKHAAETSKSKIWFVRNDIADKSWLYTTITNPLFSSSGPGIMIGLA